MRKLGELLSTIPVPDAKRLPSSAGTTPSADPSVALVTELGAGLPAGHLHLWGGPNGAGKTSFLLSLLCGAAQRQRRVVYATYDLPATTLARRLLAMTAGVAPEALPDPGGQAADAELDAEAWSRVVAARRFLSSLPFSMLEARGLTTASLQDRLVRMPFRADVLAVDYLQAVVRERGTELAAALSAFRDLASGLHLAILCAVRPDASAQDTSSREITTRMRGLRGALPDRVGWLEPSGERDRRADIVVNRHGAASSMALRVDASGALERADRA